MNKNQDRFRGMILGTAVGDALGLPAEGISKRRAEKMFKGRPRHCFIFNCGMVSDDTEHTVFVSQSLLAHPDSPEQFARRLSKCLKWWVLALPAGIGWATLRSVLRMWIGFSPEKSGVFSAGNGPAMRAAPVGAFFFNDSLMMNAFIKAAAQITHTDPKALTGAKAVAYVTAWIIREDMTQRPGAEDFVNIISAAGENDAEWQGLMDSISRACEENLSVEEFAESIGLSKGISGYIYHTVPAALYAWFRHFGDFEAAITALLKCGGDTDTAGAVAGALAGCVTGEQGIPLDWISGIWDWPRSIKVLKKIADALEAGTRDTSGQSPVSYFLPGIIPRNIFFLTIVLLHGFRRLLPPY